MSTAAQVWVLQPDSEVEPISEALLMAKEVSVATQVPAPDLEAQ